MTFRSTVRHLLLLLLIVNLGLFTSKIAQQQQETATGAADKKRFCTKKFPCLFPKGPSSVTFKTDTHYLQSFVTHSLHVDSFEHGDKSKFKFTITGHSGHQPVLMILRSKFYQFITSSPGPHATFQVFDNQLHIDFDSSTAVQIWIEQRWDWLYVAQILLAVLLCTYSQKLVSSDAFLIAVGFICGLLMAVVVTLYLMQRAFRRNIYSSLFVGYLLTGLPVLFASIANRYLKSEYNVAFILYLLGSGVCGAIAVYIYGPIENERVKRVFSVALMVIGGLMHLASETPAVVVCSLLANLMVLCVKLVTPRGLVETIMKYIIGPCPKNAPADDTEATMHQFRMECLNAGPELREQISRVRDKESFVRFLRTGEHCVPNWEEVTEATLHNIPAYELLTSDASQ